jgi:hypothetical protein
MSKSIAVSVISAAFIFFAGCASMANRPDWVNKGGGAFKDAKKALYGVGVAESITSEALRRTTADNRAIAEVSKRLSVMSTSLMRDYMSSAAIPEQEKTNGEQYIENTVKTFSSNSVSGIKIIDRWDDGKTTYALAVLELDDLKSMTDDIKQLSQKTKEYIKANADKAFDKLEEQQQKQAK